MKGVLDCELPTEVARFCNSVRRLSGKWTVELKRYRATRTNKQNATHWGMVCPVLADWITENWGQECTPDQAHEILKLSLLKETFTDPKNGQVYEIPGSTKKLDTVQFAAFFDRARDLVHELTGVVIPDPDPAYAKR